jgi:hypothetical protein
LYRLVLINGNPDDDEKLAIGDCSGPTWRLDGNGLFRSKADDNQSLTRNERTSLSTKIKSWWNRQTTQKVSVSCGWGKAALWVTSCAIMQLASYLECFLWC